MSYKKELIEICHKVYANKFVAAHDGNLSIRISENEILITPSGKCKGELREEDLIIIDNDGNLIEGNSKPSTENKIHLFAYKNRNDINAVVHCHPVYSTAFAVFGEGFENPVLPEVVLTLGKIPLCKYGTPSTNEVTDSMIPYIKESSAMLLQNHGALTLGKNIKDAYFKMEKLEQYAQIIFLARTLGGEKSLSKENIERLASISKATYGIELKNDFSF